MLEDETEEIKPTMYCVHRYRVQMHRNVLFVWIVFNFEQTERENMCVWICLRVRPGVDNHLVGSHKYCTHYKYTSKFLLEFPFSKLTHSNELFNCMVKWEPSNVWMKHWNQKLKNLAQSQSQPQAHRKIVNEFHEWICWYQASVAC